MAWAYSHRMKGLDRCEASSSSTRAAGVYMRLTTSVVRGWRASWVTPS